MKVMAPRRLEIFLRELKTRTGEILKPFSDFSIYLLWNCCLESSCTGLFEEDPYLIKISSPASVFCR